MAVRSRCLELEYILLTLDVIEEYLRDHNAETFAQDRLAVSAVKINLKQIYTLARQVAPEVRAEYPRVNWALFETLAKLEHLEAIFAVSKRRLIPCAKGIGRDLQLRFRIESRISHRSKTP